MKWILTIIFLLSMLSACTTPVAPVQTLPVKTYSWKVQQAQLSHLSTWHLSGKLALRTTQTGGSAAFDWQQLGANYHINLSGPLGIGAMQLDGRPNQVTLLANNGQRYSATSPEILLKQHSGWDLPISNLRFWIRGLPVKNLPAKYQFDARGQLIGLQQQDWHLQFSNYRTRGAYILPGKIQISSPYLTLKIVIYEWKV